MPIETRIMHFDNLTIFNQCVPLATQPSLDDSIPG